MSIPLCTPHFDGRESQYVLDCIETGWVSTVGTYVSRFEKAICEYTGANHAVAVNSGSTALHMALIAGGVESGDEVIVPSMTFIATANAVRYADAQPIFADCDDNFALDVVRVTTFLNAQDIRKDGIWNRETGRRIKAVIPVHLYGYTVDMGDLVSFCRKHQILIVEDATESLGTFYQDAAGKRHHTGIQGDLGCFSFNGNKIITTGGGGMVVTGNTAYAETLRHITTQAKIDPIFYVHDQVGYNNRLTNLQAALGLAQLEQIETFILKKTQHFNYYRELLEENITYEIRDYPEDLRSNKWFFSLRLNATPALESRDKLIQRFLNEKIQVRPVWRPLHLQEPYRKNQVLDVSTTEKLWNSTINLPCSVDLTRTEIDRVVEVLNT